MSAPVIRAARPSHVANIAYSIQRNSRGSLPVYSDIRNGRTRYQVLLKNVRGDVQALKHDLETTLFPDGSESAARLKLEAKWNDTLVVTGGRWKHNIAEWLQSRGF